MTFRILLDAGPLGIVTKRRGIREAEQCRAWVADCIAAGNSCVVPATAYYEVRRELAPAEKRAGLARLEAFCMSVPRRHLPLSDDALCLARVLWADVRRSGRPTAGARELDCDVLIAAQARTLRAAGSEEVVVATGNVGHLSRFVTARLWSEITP